MRKFDYVEKIFSLFVFAVEIIFAQFQETIPTDYWIYKLVEELKLKGYFRGLPQGYKPYSRIEVVKQILDEGVSGEFERKLFKMLEDEFQDEIKF